MVLDSAKTLNPVQKLLKSVKFSFAPCSTFDKIKLKGPKFFLTCVIRVALTSPVFNLLLAPDLLFGSALGNL